MYGRNEMYDRIRKHGENLNKIFGLNKDPIALCKQLRRLEVKANIINERYSNGDIGEKELLSGHKKIEDSLNKILGYKRKGVPVFINSDPRGYALKIRSGYAMRLNIARDWGGYGLIAPDLREG